MRKWQLGLSLGLLGLGLAGCSNPEQPAAQLKVSKDKKTSSSSSDVSSSSSSISSATMSSKPVEKAKLGTAANHYYGVPTKFKLTKLGRQSGVLLYAHQNSKASDKPLAEIKDGGVIFKRLATFAQQTGNTESVLVKVQAGKYIGYVGYSTMAFESVAHHDAKPKANTSNMITQIPPKIRMSKQAVQMSEAIGQNVHAKTKLAQSLKLNAGVRLFNSFKAAKAAAGPNASIAAIKHDSFLERDYNKAYRTVGYKPISYDARGQKEPMAIVQVKYGHGTKYIVYTSYLFSAVK